MKVIEALPQSWMSLYIEMFFNSHVLSSGTAFMVDHNDKHYLLTNWHNVTGRNPITGKPLRNDGAIPNKIQIYFNEKDRQGSWIKGELDLYKEPKDETSYIWHEHPKFKEKVDVVVIEIKKNEKIDFYPYQLQLTSSSKIYPSDKLSVVGFPFGKSSHGYLALWINGTLASDFDINYDELPAFLIDCRTREGQSGSPVIDHRNPGHLRINAQGAMQISSGFQTTLLGIYSGRINKKSDLGFVWKASAIQAIVEYAK